MLKRKEEGPRRTQPLLFLSPTFRAILPRRIRCLMPVKNPAKTVRDKKSARKPRRSALAREQNSSRHQRYQSRQGNVPGAKRNGE